jgi:hypothetical protein
MKAALGESYCGVPKKLLATFSIGVNPKGSDGRGSFGSPWLSWAKNHVDSFPDSLRPFI